jgi:hypothetical protein
METLVNVETYLNKKKFFCEKCNFEACNKNDFTKHSLSRKHQNNTKDEIEVKATHICNNCEKQFYSSSGLWKHKKNCGNNNIIEKKNEKTPEKQDMQMLVDYLIKENQEFKSMMIEMYKQKMESDTISLTNSNVISNSNIKTFNIQVFLNERCKDAMNLSEFIDNMKVELSDMESIGENGYVEGISEVIARSLSSIELEKRPIHCTDLKRETVYVKEDNKWEKQEKAREKLQYLIDEVQKKNIKLLPKWKEIYPTCVLSNSVYTDKYNIMCHELMGGDCQKVKLSDKDSRIMTRIARQTVLDKKDLINN